MLTNGIERNYALTIDRLACLNKDLSRFVGLVTELSSSSTSTSPLSTSSHYPSSKLIISLSIWSSDSPPKRVNGWAEIEKKGDVLAKINRIRPTVVDQKTIYH